MGKTDMKIDEEIVQRTTNCELNFRCLSGDKRCLCEVKVSIGYDMVEIKPKLVLDCKYHVTFGNTSFCICPTRNEIFKRYSM